MQTLTPFLEEVIEPISEAKPCGDDLTYTDVKHVQNELNKRNSLGGVDYLNLNERGASVSVDFTFIVETSRTILRNKSKDLRVAGYLAVGLFHTEGLAGMAEGLATMNLLAETYWDALHPERPGRRANALKAAEQQLTAHLKAYKPEPEDRAPLEHGLAALEQLQSLLLEKLQTDAPDLSELKGLLEAHLKAVTKPTPPKPDQVAKQAPPPVEPKGKPVQQTAPEDETPEVKDDKKSQGDMGPTTEAAAYRQVLMAATFLGEQDQTRVLPYRLRRLLRWGSLQLPSSKANGKTAIPPPSNFKQLKASLEELLERGAYAKLAERAEALFQAEGFEYWLGLQRLVVTGMDALGVPFERARDAVLQETADLVERLPELPALTYVDGTPFAEPHTREWIELRVHPMQRVGGDPAETHQAQEGSASRLDQLFDTARRQLLGNDLEGALATMQEGAAHDLSREDQFRRRLFLARLYLKGNVPAIACPMLENLDAEVERHDLETWHPPLALDVWSNLYRCYEALVPRVVTPDEQQMMRSRAVHTFNKICRVDPQYALQLTRKKT